ncbi:MULTISPECIES: hypothetical protein [Nostocales]|jgi:hypothetical protein|uniref:CpcD n=1 Tax=Aphanizomenon flos-aquae FACHB-1040 TaxID=2692887 RepID=A0ABR8BWZ0_APHFL|nr:MULTISPECIES: hypothetical protein [Nostocales]ALB39239.1 hypothetical protein AA650_01050 [Anabaena sp. WA102]MBD2278575.1 hypothetical protein [Aphanizomenon flos-aquae FACHB-1040]OBQ21241.1 MAG: hypothetical protein AN486_04955 [Anabaena sp. AL93]
MKIAIATNELSRLALKIVVGAREQRTGNREQEESFGRFYKEREQGTGNREQGTGNFSSEFKAQSRKKMFLKDA